MQIFAWGSSYYLMAVLALPIATDTGWPLTYVVGALSLGFLVAGLASPTVGAAIARHGGRPVLIVGCLLLALGLLTLALATALWMFWLGWVIIGAGMAAGLYDPAFATLGRLYGRDARRAITTLTLWGGFASTVCWPLSALMLEQFGWRGTAVAYAAVHLCLSVPLLLWLVPSVPGPPAASRTQTRLILDTAERRAFHLMATILTLTGLTVTVISVHLIALLATRGVPLAAAVALGALIGPLFGILIADFYVVRKQRVDVDALYTMSEKGEYWYSNGYNMKAVWTMIPSALIPILCVIVPALRGGANYAWFIGMGLGFVIYTALNRKS